MSDVKQSPQKLNKVGRDVKDVPISGEMPQRRRLS